MLEKVLIAAIAVAAAFGLSAGPSAMQQTASKTAAGCLQEVRDFASRRMKELAAATTPFTPPANADAAMALARERAAEVSRINQAKTAMAVECAARLDTATVSEKDLVSLGDLYNEAGQPGKMKEVVGRALASKTLSPADRASMLGYAVRAGLREPKSDERNARLERHVAELDRSAAATFEQKLEAHAQMNSWYRYDDVDAGIIRHSTWIIDARKKATAEQRTKAGPAAVAAYVNLAQAWAGQGMNDQAIALLVSAPTELADVPNVSRSVEPELARLRLVGTPGAAITAPRWLNLPAGQTELPMPGSVTLLEFSAHWCVPCKESYPGVNRLRAKYGSRGFRVVLATQLYGYFESAQNLTPQAEIERDRAYFAEHGMNVAVAIADRPSAGAPNPNDRQYRVGGIPQIHLVDKQGRVRLVMVGYDDANEPKLATMIEALLKEK